MLKVKLLNGMEVFGYNLVEGGQFMRKPERMLFLLGLAFLN